MLAKAKKYFRSTEGKGYLTIIGTTMVTTVVHNPPLWYFFAYSTFGCIVFFIYLQAVQLSSFKTRNLWIARLFLMRAQVELAIGKIAERYKWTKLEELSETAIERSVDKCSFYMKKEKV